MENARSTSWGLLNSNSRRSSDRCCCCNICSFSSAAACHTRQSRRRRHRRCWDATRTATACCWFWNACWLMTRWKWTKVTKELSLSAMKMAESRKAGRRTATGRLASAPSRSRLSLPTRSGWLFSYRRTRCPHLRSPVLFSERRNKASNKSFMAWVAYLYLPQPFSADFPRELLKWTLHYDWDQIPR